MTKQSKISQGLWHMRLTPALRKKVSETSLVYTVSYSSARATVRNYLGISKPYIYIYIYMYYVCIHTHSQMHTYPKSSCQAKVSSLSTILPLGLSSKPISSHVEMWY